MIHNMSKPTLHYLIWLGLILALAACAVPAQAPAHTTLTPPALADPVIGPPTAKVTIIEYGDFG